MFSYTSLGLLAFLLLWGLATLKSVLFWLYLWQLKEYHIGRFIDHFRTHKGKKALLNTVFGVKVLVLVIFLITYITNDWGYLIWGTLGFFIIYVIEDFRTGVGLLGGILKRPVFTPKMIVLFLIALTCMILVFFTTVNSRIDGAVWLLSFDILAPVIISGIVLLIQPFFVLIRNNTLKKATKKISQFPNVKVIAITGSYGKTSTKEFLQTILALKFKVLATGDHKNSEMGIANTILKELKPEHEIFIVEMGAYNKGGINLLCNMVKPHIGVVTGVNEQHLSTFRSMDNLLSAEGGRELLSNLPKDGLLVINGDNKYCLDLYKSAHIDKRVYSLKGDKVDADIFANEITVEETRLDFLIMTKEKNTFHFNVNVLGRQNVQNLLGAILIAKELGMSLEEISQAIKNIRQEQAGITLKKGIHGINIIDSSYSSNPDGVMADLDYLNVFKGNPSTGLRVKKVIVMPCLIELGNKSGQVHYQIGKKIAEVCDLAVITTKDRFEDMKKGAVSENMVSDKVVFLDKPQEILNAITTFCKEGDTVLLEGRVPNELIKLLAIKEKPNSR